MFPAHVIPSTSDPACSQVSPLGSHLRLHPSHPFSLSLVYEWIVQLLRRSSGQKPRSHQWPALALSLHLQPASSSCTSQFLGSRNLSPIHPHSSHLYSNHIPTSLSGSLQSILSSVVRKLRIKNQVLFKSLTWLCMILEWYPKPLIRLISLPLIWALYFLLHTPQNYTHTHTHTHKHTYTSFTTCPNLTNSSKIHFFQEDFPDQTSLHLPVMFGPSTLTQLVIHHNN